MKKYHSLQAGRAIGALLVLWHHLSTTFALEKYYNTNLFRVNLDLGMLGVLYFFVLSGFLIASVHSKDLNQPKQFLPYLKKRAIRVYPTYWLVFIVALVGTSMQPNPAMNLPSVLTCFKALLLIPLDRG